MPSLKILAVSHVNAINSSINAPPPIKTLLIFPDPLWVSSHSFTLRAVNLFFIDPLLSIFEPTCAYARLAHIHPSLSVCHWTKIH